jgi:hypothetical protein
LVSIERQESKLGKAEENLDFETQGERNGWKSEDVSKLRKGPTRTRLHQKKLIAPSCVIGFLSFLAWIKPQESKLRNGRRNFGFWNSGWEKQLKKWRVVRTEKGTDRVQSSPEIPHSSLVRYWISKLFGLNQTAREQAMQWQENVWILKLRAKETAEKVKMCQNLGREQPRPGFTRKCL